MKPYPLVDDLLRPILRVAITRAGRLDAPGGTGHVVARCNHREFGFTTSAGSVPDSHSPPTRETKNPPRDSTHSSSWRPKGVRYLFSRRCEGYKVADVSRLLCRAARGRWR